MIEHITHLPITVTKAAALLVPTSMYIRDYDRAGVTALEDVVMDLENYKQDKYFEKRIITSGRTGSVVTLWNTNTGWIPKMVFALPTRYLIESKPEVSTIISGLESAKAACKRWEATTLAIDLDSFHPFDNVEMLEFLIEEVFEGSKITVEVYKTDVDDDTEPPFAAGNAIDKPVPEPLTGRALILARASSFFGI